MGSLGCVASADRQKAPGRAFDHGILKRDIGRSIARNRCIPAITESHLDELDMLGFPKKEAMESESDIPRICTDFIAFLHLVGDFVREFLMALAIACRCTIRWRVAEIDAAQLANGLAQRLTGDDSR